MLAMCWDIGPAHAGIWERPVPVPKGHRTLSQTTIGVRRTFVGGRL